MWPVSTLFFTLLVAGNAGAAQDLLRHDLKIELFPAQHRLRGTDTRYLAGSEGSRIDFFLAPAAEISEVFLAEEPVPFRFHKGRLRLRLPGNLDRPEKLVIAYQATFNDPVPERPLHTEDPSYGVSAAITPGGAFLGGGAGWYPSRPDEEAGFRLRVEAPSGYLAVTDGQLMEQETDANRSISVWRIERSREGLTLSAGQWEVRTTPSGEIPVYTFFYPGTGQLAETYLQSAKGYLELYQGLFGPYPFAKFAVVENFFPTGYGFPSWTLLGSTVVHLPFIVETSLGHEIAHSWWGNGVLVDYSQGNWSEGLTTYVADHLYKERSSAEEGRDYRLKLLRGYATLVPPEKDFALSGFGSRSNAAEQAVGYGKAAMVFHMARKRIGDDAFWSGLRQIARSRLFTRTSWGDFAAALGRAGRQNLEPFFDQWVRRPGAPVITLDDVSAEKAGGRWVVSGVIRQKAPFYDLHLPLRLETAAGEIMTTVESRTGTASFRMTSGAAPVRLVVDPEVDLFRRLDPSEIPPTVNGIRGSKDLLVVAADDMGEEDLAAGRLLLAALRQPGARIAAERDLSAADLSGKDLLFLGIPADRELLPELPAGLALGKGGFSLQGKNYTAAGTALFAVLPHPVDPGRVAAIFYPRSSEAARLAARKIPHYGRYSYLAFDKGVNRARGTWEVDSSPTIHVFDLKEKQP